MARDLALVVTFFAALIGASFSLTGFFIPAGHSATISGQVVIPESDMGYKPYVYDMKVRAEGTEISANVVPTSKYTADFALPEVPSGPITLLLTEKSDQDVFTQASKRVEVNVTGDTVTGVSFNLAYHWKNLAGYPSNMGTTGYVNEWTPHFVSEQVGFILFRVRGTGIDPERVELYRTVNGGVSWDEIGHWTYGEVPYPDNLALSFYFFDENHGVIQALADANASPDVVWYHTRGVLQTSDGGTTWNYVDFPNPSEDNASDDIVIKRFAGIDSSHWVACGTNAGTSSYGLPSYPVIWETTNGGSSWQVKFYWQEDYGTCTGLGANPDGKAIAFYTPYAWGGLKKVVLRDPAGNWTSIENNELITNSGYGPADIPMVGDNAWVRNDDHSTQIYGLYRSNDAGLSWGKISDFLAQYMDFASELKGFALAGGPAYVTYDGGVTWLYQSQGGGICCHGNNILSFDPTHAIWQDGGVGDPNNAPSLFTYVEPWEANFEILSGVSLTNGFALKGDTHVAAASYRLFNHGPVPLNIKSIKLNAFGVGYDAAGIGTVKLWWDKNANGSVDAEDALIDSSSYSSDDGVITFTIGANYLLQQFVPFYLLVTYDISNNANDWDTFSCFINLDEVEAETLDTHTPVFPTAPLGYQLPGRITTVPSAFDDIPTEHWAKDYVYALAESGITGGCGDPGFCPDDPVTRAQMAVFIETSLGVLLAPPCVGDIFPDVNPNTVSTAFCGYIERLAADGITGGCGNGNFCPDTLITRAEMAVFIEAALGNAANVCTGRFVDVPDGNPFCGFVERLADDGVTGGCTAATFCPDNPVTRAEMAVFLVAAPSPLMP